jgi:hypothetical protein
MRLTGIKEQGGPWYLFDHEIIDAAGKVALPLGRTDWADWSRSGEVLFAREGRLYRVRVDKPKGLTLPEELIDLRTLAFESVSAPSEALSWGGPMKQRRKISRV